MLKFKYVKQYQVGEKVEIPVAENLLAEYNDFYASNLEIYQGRIKNNNGVENETVADDPEAEEMDPQALKRINDDVRAFAAQWGSLDFASATLVGLEIDWDKIQEKLLKEQATHVRPAESKLIPVAYQLRQVASILAFSERIITRLHSKHVDQAMIDLMIQGFEALLAQVAEEDLAFPELNGMESKKFAKLRTVDAIIDYANNLFALGR